MVVAGGGGGGVVAGGGGIGAIIDQQGQHFFGDPLGVDVGVAPNVVFVGQWLEERINVAVVQEVNVGTNKHGLSKKKKRMLSEKL